MKKTLFTLGLVVAMTSGCFKNYFQVNTDPKWSVDRLKEAGESKKNIIVHFGDAVRKLDNPIFDSTSVSGNLSLYAASHKNVDPDPANKKHPYKYSQRQELASEVHVYVTDRFNGQTDFTINEQNFKEVRVYEHNKGATTSSHIFGFLAILGGIVAAVGIAFAIACSCPQVYLETGPDQYEFLAGMYSGAIMSNLERTDMLPLTGFIPAGDTIRMKITGLPGETQFINNASMRKLIHPEGTEVVGSRIGDLFIIHHLQTPKKVMAGEIVDRSKSVLYRDGNGYGFHINDSAAGLSSLVLQYERKHGENKALLVSRLKNTDWGGFLFREFKGLYGSGYANWISQQEKSGSTQMIEWQKQQGLLLKVSVLTENGWEYADYFASAGNTASRDMAMEIDISRARGNTISIKLESAFRFWEVDQAVICYDAAKMNNAEDVEMVAATKNGNDQSSILQEKDKGYVTLGKADQLMLEFVDRSRSAGNGNKTTYVFVAGGYYHQDPINQQPLQANELIKFRNPGQFHKFSVSKYNELGMLP